MFHLFYSVRSTFYPFPIGATWARIPTDMHNPLQHADGCSRACEGTFKRRSALWDGAGLLLHLHHRQCPSMASQDPFWRSPPPEPPWYRVWFDAPRNRNRPCCGRVPHDAPTVLVPLATTASTELDSDRMGLAAAMWDGGPRKQKHSFGP